MIVLDSRAYGGQAGASARIENYFGFPTGISGQALTARAFVQAEKFGAEMMIPAVVRTLDCSRADGALSLEIEDDGRIDARTVVIASGARYRRPACANLASFEGRGVLVLGFADRGAALRRRGGDPRRRRKFGGSGGGVPLGATPPKCA